MLMKAQWLIHGVQSGLQIGKNCHISGGVGIGGVLEPLQAAPVIIGIGARSEVAEGFRVGEGRSDGRFPRCVNEDY